MLHGRGVLMLVIVVCIPLLWACGDSSSSSSGATTTTTPAPNTPGTAQIEVAAVTTEDAKTWNDTTVYVAEQFPYKDYFSSGYTTVALGRVVWLSGSATPPTGATVSTYSWSSAPAVSFSYVTDGTDTTQQKPYFTPTVAGQYQVTLTVTFSDATTATKTLTVTAAEYVGKATCAGCHATLYNEWLRANATDRMNHATDFAEKAGGMRGPFSASCLNRCHTVGYDYKMLGTSNPSNSGWDDSVRHGLANDGASWFTAATAALTGNYENPVGSGIWYTNASLLNQPAAQADLNSIQCESCHGPGGQHYGDPTKISKSYSEKTCTSVCHAGGQGYDYAQSGHSGSASGGSTYLGASCNKCHTTDGFINVTDKGNTAVDYTTATSVACAACHNLHAAEHDDMLRFEGNVTVSGTSVNAHVSAGCVKCHTDEGATVGSKAYHSQAEMFYGVTLAGGKGYNYPGKTYANMGHAAEVEESCAECHMADTIMPYGKSDVGGPYTTITQDITASATSFYIGTGSLFPLSGGTLRIENEQITYSAITTVGTTAYNVVVTARGANGTTAAAHAKGALVTYGSGSKYRVGAHSWTTGDDVLGNDTDSVADITTWLNNKKDNYFNTKACNDCHRGFNAPATTFNGLPLRTNLTNGLALSSTNSIAVNSTTGFPVPGTIQIGAEQLTYTAVTATTFGNGTAGTLTRGANGTGPTYLASTAGSSSRYSVVVSDSITVASTANFPNAGVLAVEYFPTSGTREVGRIREKISYTSKTATTFDGCRRGIGGWTSVVQHPSGTAITLLPGVQALVINPALGVADHTTTLGTAMTTSTTGNVTIGNATGWTAGGVVKIDSEFMSFTYVNATTINITGRALYGSTAASHTASATQPKVYLAAMTHAATDTIYVGDTDGPLPFPSQGIVRISGEVIRYSGKTATTLTGLTRGLAGTMAVAHMPYDLVELQLFSPHYDATPVATQVADFQKQVATMLKTLEDLLPKDGSGNVMVSDASMTTKQKNGAFNYYFVKNDGSYGIHNYTYAMQLLYDSIIDVGGAPPYSRP